jgi:hypothetical protein
MAYEIATRIHPDTAKRRMLCSCGMGTGINKDGEASGALWVMPEQAHADVVSHRIWHRSN